MGAHSDFTQRLVEEKMHWMELNRKQVIIQDYCSRD